MKLTIEGMACGKCAKRVQNALEAIDGVQEADVSHETGVANVITNKDVDEKIFVAAVEEAGYKVVSVE